MIKVEIWSDLNCPFCYIGKRHLEMALAQFQNSDKFGQVVRKDEEQAETMGITAVPHFRFN